MLKLALDSQLPLIKVVTDDLISVGEILAHLVGDIIAELKPDQLPHLSKPTFESERSYFFMIEPDGIEYKQVYEVMAKTERTLVVVNPVQDDNAMFDAGEVNLPKEMLQEFLAHLVEEGSVDNIINVLGGLSLKEVGEVCRLTTTEYSELSHRAIIKIRKMFYSNQKGVVQVDTSYPYYYPDAFLENWVLSDGRVFLLNDIPKELVPRGLLLGGAPGTGKTLGAKYLANYLEIPLYRIDLASMLGKYVGESEANLKNALRVVDQAQPCMLLIDEVEKVFENSGDDTGVSRRMLSGLLWWMQEHTSRVLTVMTTNDSNKLPQELYRAGRIDKHYTFQSMTDWMHIKEFILGVIDSVDHLEINIDRQSILKTISTSTTHGNVLSNADITQRVYDEVKKQLMGSI